MKNLDVHLSLRSNKEIREKQINLQKYKVSTSTYINIC